jgi:hypothetical protein
VNPPPAADDRLEPAAGRLLLALRLLANMANDTASPAPANNSALRIDRYEIIRVLGQGSFGKVRWRELLLACSEFAPAELRRNGAGQMVG